MQHPALNLTVPQTSRAQPLRNDGSRSEGAGTLARECHNVVEGPL